MAIEVGLRTRGCVSADPWELTVSIPEWRAFARTIARRLGRPVRTGLDPDRDLVWASIADWPRDDHERDITEAAKRHVVRTLSE